MTKVCFDQSVWQCKPLVRLVYTIKVSVTKVCFDQSVWQCKPLVRLVYTNKVTVSKVFDSVNLFQTHIFRSKCFVSQRLITPLDIQVWSSLIQRSPPPQGTQNALSSFSMQEPIRTRKWQEAGRQLTARPRQDTMRVWKCWSTSGHL